jgi:hypothetical protein
VYHLFTDVKEAYDSVRGEVLYNILIEFDTPTKPVRLMCLNETYINVWTGKPLPHRFPMMNGLKPGDALLPLLFSFL